MKKDLELLIEEQFYKTDKVVGVKLLNEIIYSSIEEEAARSSLNAVLSRINEIQLCYFLVGSWSKVQEGQLLKQDVESRAPAVGEDLYEEQVNRAKEMARAALQWASENGFDGKPIKSWWTPVPAKLSSAVGKPVSSGNPSDALVQFQDGSFLGISAKSTKGKGDIGFKNPGLGTLSIKLGMNFEEMIAGIEEKLIKAYKLPTSKKERKDFIRNNASIQAKTIEAGKQILNKLRDEIFKKYSSMKIDDVRNNIMSVWLDASESYPYYIKVTGRGKKGGTYSADVFDPIKNEKFKTFASEPILFTKIGTDSIGVSAGGKKLFKMRLKYESEKLASSIKLSGDPW